MGVAYSLFMGIRWNICVAGGCDCCEMVDNVVFCEYMLLLNVGVSALVFNSGSPITRVKLFGTEVTELDFVGVDVGFCIARL